MLVVREALAFRSTVLLSYHNFIMMSVIWPKAEGISVTFLWPYLVAANYYCLHHWDLTPCCNNKVVSGDSRVYSGLGGGVPNP